jgi:glutamate carboxypeptidase
MALSPGETRILEGLPPLEALVARLSALVGESSHTSDREGVDRVGRVCEAALERLGFRISVVVTGVTGQHVLARRRAGEGGRVLLIGHLDTVHPKDGRFRGLAVDGDRAVGPGAADMKGGIVVMLGALEALASAGRLGRGSVTVVLNADEEVGSPTSTDVIRLEAEESDVALGFEHGSEHDGATAIVTARRGIGRMVVEATGAAAHAGSETERGASAVHELAHKIGELNALESPERRTSVNVGTFEGGTAANVVAERAAMTIDYRFPDKETGDELSAAITDVVSEPWLRSRSGRPLVRTVCREHVLRPPLVRTAAVARAAALAIEAARDLGHAVVEEGRGGSSDAALAFDAGCPAICGMGVVGGAIHTDREWVRLSSLRERAALAAIAVERLLGGGRPA